MVGQRVTSSRFKEANRFLPKANLLACLSRVSETDEVNLLALFSAFSLSLRCR